MAGRRNLKAMIAAMTTLALAGCMQAGGGRLATADPAAPSAPTAETLPVTALAPVGPAPAARSVPMPGQQGAPSPVAARPTGEYPNINEAPPEREGQLLPPAQRAKVISELQALRAQQKRAVVEPAPSSAAALRATGQTHGAEAIRRIEQCATAGLPATLPASRLRNKPQARD